jgi:hypothetical protein
MSNGFFLFLRPQDMVLAGKPAPEPSLRRFASTTESRGSKKKNLKLVIDHAPG